MSVYLFILFIYIFFLEVAWQYYVISSNKKTIDTWRHRHRHKPLHCTYSQSFGTNTIRYNRREFNVDSKGEYSALSSTRGQKKKLKQTTPASMSSRFQDNGHQTYWRSQNWPFRVTWRHLIPRWPLPIGAPLSPSLYSSRFRPARAHRTLPRNLENEERESRREKVKDTPQLYRCIG